MPLSTACCCRLGPILTLAVGCVLHAGGYLTLWAAARGALAPPYWVLLAVAFLACNAQTYFETGAMVTSVRNFETERWGDPACRPGSEVSLGVPRSLLLSPCGPNANPILYTLDPEEPCKPWLTRRGTVIGVLKAFLGLSGSFFTTVYVSFLDPDAVSFLLMLALVPAAVVLACTPFINYVPYIQVEPHTKVRPPVRMLERCGCQLGCPFRAQALK